MTSWLAPLWNAIAITAFILLAAAIGVAHEIPADIYTTVFVKQEPERVRVVVRLPLAAVRDFVYPEQEGGYLDFPRLAPHLPELARQWVVQGMEVRSETGMLGTPEVTAAQLSLASDSSFSVYDRAVARLSQPLPTNEMKVAWNQLWFDVLLDYPSPRGDSPLSIRTGFERLAERVSVTVRFLALKGEERLYSLHIDGGVGDTGMLHLDPRWHQAAGRFLVMGFWHILEGIDHLLFLACLVIPLRKLRPLVLVVTAFTVAHSITLLAASMGYVPDTLWFPPFVEAMIALSIVLMALGNVVGAVSGTPLNPKGQPADESWGSRWKLAFAFGLVHGFGFSFLLRESMQFATGHLAASLLAFNVGVECGQIVVLLVLAPLLNLLFRIVVAERIGVIVLSALIAHTGWHWLAERGEVVLRYLPATAWGTVPDTSTFLAAGGAAATLVAVCRWVIGFLARERP